MDDLAISELLSSLGLVGEHGERARERLHREGLTRPGKTRIAAPKVEAVERTLGGAAFVRHCRKPACAPTPGEERVPVLVAAVHCETCGGSDNRRAVDRMLAAMGRMGWSKLLVASGSPGTRGELERLCADGIDLRFLTEEPAPAGGPSRRCSSGRTSLRFGWPPRFRTRRRRCCADPRC